MLFDEDYPAVFASYLIRLRFPQDRLLPEFYWAFAQTERYWEQARALVTGGGQPQFNGSALIQLKIPLPPLEVQREIVAEIEGYQKVINGARAVLDNYRPHIPVHPDWPMVKLGEICSFKNGLNFNKTSSGHTVKIIGVSDFQANLYAPLADLEEVHLDAPLKDEYLVRNGDILFVRSNGNPDLVGRSVIVPPPIEPTTFSGFTIRGRIEDERAFPLFYAHFFKSRDFAEMIKTVGQGANIRNLSQGILNELKVPLPSLTAQQAIVAEIEAEQGLVAANHELIDRFEKKIQSTLNHVWGEDQPVRAEA
jgi:type I restriction enzyme M protein